MKILNAFKSAGSRSVKSWRTILIIWLLSFLLVSLLAIPMKGALKSGFGNSMITENLREGFNVEVFADMGTYLKSLASLISSGFFLALIFGLILNAFVTGGLFDCLKGSETGYSAAEFFRASAKNFWSFLVVSLILSLIIYVGAILIIVLPVSLTAQSDTQSDLTIIRTGIISISVFSLLLAIMLLAADYARAWQVIQDKSRPFSAIGFGFGQTFRTFLSSYPMMIILMVLQLLYLWLVSKIIPGMYPGSGSGIFLLFLLSQFLFIIKIFLRVIRYGSVTALMEINPEKEKVALSSH